MGWWERSKLEKDGSDRTLKDGEDVNMNLRELWSSVRLLLSHVRLFAIPRPAARQASLSITNSWSLLKLMSIESAMPSKHLSSSVIPFSSHLQSFLVSESFSMSQFFTSGSQVLEFQHQCQSFQWIFRTDFLGIDGFDILAVQGTFKSLLQHHSSKALILWCSAFFIVQLSHLYMTTGKTIALTRWTSVSKVMSLLLNMLSRLVIAFLSRSKHLLI